MNILKKRYLQNLRLELQQYATAPEQGYSPGVDNLDMIALMSDSIEYKKMLYIALAELEDNKDSQLEQGVVKEKEKLQKQIEFAPTLLESIYFNPIDQNTSNIKCVSNQAERRRRLEIITKIKMLQRK